MKRNATSTAGFNNADRSIYRSTTFWLLATNVFLVLAGYALAMVNGNSPEVHFQQSKYAVLFISWLALIVNRKAQTVVLLRLGTRFYLLALLLLLSTLNSDQSSYSLFRTLAFVAPFLYLVHATGVLLIRYPFHTTIRAVNAIVHCVYLLPVAGFFVVGGDLIATNIYYTTPGLFASNHFGWSGLLVMTSGIDLLTNGRIRREVVVLICLNVSIGFYLLLVSGSRSSWLSLAVVLLIMILRYHKLGAVLKIIFLAMLFVPAGIFWKDPDSALRTRFQKTKQQMKSGEPRQAIANRMFRHFSDRPWLYLTGIGTFNVREIRRISGKDAYHNSYFDVLFGAGLFTFSIFAYWLVLQPAYLYFAFLARDYLSFPPLLLIPFFESNLSGGQFLFFPWMIWAICITSYASIAKIRSQKQNRTTVKAIK